MVSTEYSTAVNKLRVELLGTASSNEALTEPRLFKVYLTPPETQTAPVEISKPQEAGGSSRKRKGKPAPIKKRTKFSLPEGPDAIRQLIQTIATEEASGKGIELDPEVMSALLSAGEDLVDEQLSKAPEVEEGEEEEDGTVNAQIDEGGEDTDSNPTSSSILSVSTTSPVVPTTTSTVTPTTTSTATTDTTPPTATSTTTSTSTDVTTSTAPPVASSLLASPKHTNQSVSISVVHLWKDGFSINNGVVLHDAAVIDKLSEGKAVPELQSSIADEQVLVIIEDHGTCTKEEATSDNILCGWCRRHLLRVDYDEHEQKCAILSNKRGLLVANEKTRAAKKNLEGQECKQQ